MQTPDCITIDFETEKIESRPVYPPRPVGVSIKWPGGKSRYYAWGHPNENNCTYQKGHTALKEAWDSDYDLLFHHAKFDIAVAVEKMGMEIPAWDRVQDTVFLAFLTDPHNKKHGLKSLAEDILDWPPEERDALAYWLWEHKDHILEKYGVKINKEKGRDNKYATKTSTGENISLTPGSLCTPYAEGDTDRTWGLFEHMYPLVVENGMLEAYNRERQVMPILMENEREGMCVDEQGLEEDIESYEAARNYVEECLRTRLNDPDLNLDSDDDYAEALSREGIVDDDKWTMTKGSKIWRESGGEKGTPPKRSVAKGNLRPDMYNDPDVASAYGYYSRLGTCLNMFMIPWLEQAQVNNGRITTNWNQTRGEGGGTRTGRPSTSNHNFLNISKEFKDGGSDGYVHPKFLDVPELPLVRKYVLPDPGTVFCHRDFDGQELRVFAHFEQGELYQQYLKDPNLDPHAFIGDKVNEITANVFERTIVKNINFGKLYGAGIPRVMELIRGTKSEAQELSAIHDEAMPGINIVKEEIKRIVRGGDPIRTWGGRCYFEEDRKFEDGRWKEFLYKLLNYLIQGSAADITKEALIRWYNHPDRHPTDRFLVTVYDEINFCCKPERLIIAMRILLEVMEGMELDVILLSSPKVGRTWGDCVKPNKGESEEVFLERMQLELAA